MKLIIDIPNEVYDWHVNGFPDEEDAVRLLDIVKNGTPLEECEDCVSRQAAIDCFKKWQPYMATRLFEFEKELFGLPPVTPAEKVGRWIYIGNKDMNQLKIVECSVCHKRNIGSSDYCPSCGRKMQEVEE